MVSTQSLIQTGERSEPSQTTFAGLWNKFRTIIDSLWGYDFFISYAQDDGLDYPKKLKELLETETENRGFSVFLDSQDGFHAGDNLNILTRRRVRSSTYLIVIGRENALRKSKWVAREAQHFLEAQNSRGTGRVPVLITTKEMVSAPATKAFSGNVLYERDDLDAWLHVYEKFGTADEISGPTTETLNALSASFRGRRREANRTRVFGLLAIVLFILALASGLFAVQAIQSQEQAERNLTVAQQNLAESFKAQAKYNRGGAYAAQALSVRNNSNSRRYLSEFPAATLVDTIRLKNFYVSSMAISENGLLAIGGREGQFQVMSLRALGQASSVFEVQLDATEISAMAFNPTQDKVAVTQLNGSVWILDIGESERLPNKIFPVDGRLPSDLSLNKLAYLSDGRLALVADEETGETLYVFDQNGALSGAGIGISQFGSIADIAAHPVDTKLAVLFSGDAVQVVSLQPDNVPTVETVRRDFPVGPTLGSSVSGLTISYDPKPISELDPAVMRDQIVVGTVGSDIWRLNEEGEFLPRVGFPGSNDTTPRFHVNSVAFTKDGRFLIAIRGDGDVAVFEEARDWRLRRVISGHLNAGYDPQLACCAKSALLVTSSSGEENSVLKVWDITSSHHSWALYVEDAFSPSDTVVSALAFDNGGNRLAVGTDKGQKLVIDVQDLSVLTYSQGHHYDGRIRSLVFGTQEHADVLFSAGDGLITRSLDLSSCSETDLIVETDFDLFALAWDSRAAQLIGAPFDLSEDDPGWIGRFEIGSGAQLVQDTRKIDTVIEQVVVTAGATPIVLAKGFAADEFFVWYSDKDAPTKLPVGTELGVSSFASSSDGKTVLFGHSSSVERWSIRNGVLVRIGEIPCPENDPCSASLLAVDPNGDWFAAVSGEEILVRDLETGSVLTTLSGHTGQIEVLVVSPKGNLLASGGYDGSVVLWELSTLFKPASQVARRASAISGFVLKKGELVETESADPKARERVLAAHGLSNGDFQLGGFSWDTYTHDQRPLAACKPLNHE